MISRRDWLKLSAAAGAMTSLGACGRGTAEQGAAGQAGAGSAIGAPPSGTGTLRSQAPLTRVIPGTQEALPVIGLGSAATFSQMARSPEAEGLRDVMAALMEGGGTVLDTAPGYGASEEVVGRFAHELAITEQMFWATKLNVVPRGESSADPAEARAQVERSFERFNIPQIDLIQVHNMADPPTQLGILSEYKDEGRIRYLGITTTSKRQYEHLLEVMASEPLDFIGIDYAVDNRSAEEEVLPLAQERGIGVLVYYPFGRSRMWSRIGETPVPEWAAEFGAETWAQFMLKFIVAHPAVTCATPGTSSPEHMLDNMGAAYGRLPDADEIARMVELVEALPPAPSRRRN